MEQDRVKGQSRGFEVPTGEAGRGEAPNPEHDNSEGS